MIADVHFSVEVKSQRASKYDCGSMPGAAKGAQGGQNLLSLSGACDKAEHRPTTTHPLVGRCLRGELTRLIVAPKHEQGTRETHRAASELHRQI